MIYRGTPRIVLAALIVLGLFTAQPVGPRCRVQRQPADRFEQPPPGILVARGALLQQPLQVAAELPVHQPRSADHCPLLPECKNARGEIAIIAVSPRAFTARPAGGGNQGRCQG